MFIFPRVRHNPELLNDCPPGAWAECHPSGWMQTEIFFSWFKKFVVFSGASKNSPVLLLLDGHHTHTKNIFLIEYARDHGVIMLCFPPHCTHRLQPLDVGFMKPLSTFYEGEVSSWLRANPGRVVTQFQIAKLFGNAFVKAATMATAINSFRKTGIWPTDRNVFTDVDFVAAETTNLPIQEDAEAPVIPETIATENESENIGNVPGCSFWPDKDRPKSLAVSRNLNKLDLSPIVTPKPLPIHVTPEKSMALSPEDIIPIPVVTDTIKRQKRKRGKTVILTSTPYKNELHEKADKKSAKGKQEEKIKTKKLVNTGRKKKAKQVKRNLNLENKPRVRKESFSSDSSVDDEPCLYCNYLYSESTEGWVQCWKCKKWAHCSCAGEEEEDDEVVHLCALCQ